MDTGWLTQGRSKGSLWHYLPFTFGLLGRLGFCKRLQKSRCASFQTRPALPKACLCHGNHLFSIQHRRPPLRPSLSIHRCCVRQDARWTQVHTRSLAFPEKPLAKSSTSEWRLKALGRSSQRGLVKHCRADIPHLRIELFLKVVSLGLKLGVGKTPV